jgi:hypothetical protein
VPAIGHGDKLIHLTAYLTLALWFGGVYRPAATCRREPACWRSAAASSSCRACSPGAAWSWPTWPRTRPAWPRDPALLDGARFLVPVGRSAPAGGAMSASLKERMSSRPLADRMRPQSLEEIVGQAHLLSPGKAAACRARERAGAFLHPVGTAGHRQDDAGPPDRFALRGGVHRAIGCDGRGEGRPRRRGQRARRRATSAAWERSCSSMKCIASTRRSRMRSFRSSRTGPSCSSARRRRILRSSSTTRSCREHGSTC